MKHVYLAGALAIALLCPASAQTAKPAEPASARANTKLSPETRNKIKTYINEKKLKPAAVSSRAKKGDVIDKVELSEVPADWGPELTKYRYVYADDRVIFVDPTTRKFIRIVKLSR